MIKAEELDFLNKLTDYYNKESKRMRISMKWLFIISLLAIAVSKDLIIIQEDITFLNLNFKMNSSFVILVISGVLIIIQQNTLSLLSRTEDLNERIIQIYKAMNLNPKIFKESDYEYLSSTASPLVLDETLFSKTKLTRLYTTLYMFLHIMLVLILPIVAQVFAFLKLKGSIEYFSLFSIVYVVILIVEVILFITTLVMLKSWTR